MTFKKLKQLIYSDIYRNYGSFSLRNVIKALTIGIGVKYVFWFRLVAYLKGKGLLWFPLYVLSRMILSHYSFKYGMDIPYATNIGPGLYIGHFGTIVVSANAVIGKNCNLSQGVTIGVSSRGVNKGCPLIGDNVYIAPGVKIIGKIRIGNNVAIGANAVVTKDIPDNAVVVGIPAKKISDDGSKGYVVNVDYDQVH